MKNSHAIKISSSVINHKKMSNCVLWWKIAVNNCLVIPFNSTYNGNWNTETNRVTQHSLFNKRRKLYRYVVLIIHSRFILAWNKHRLIAHCQTYKSSTYLEVCRTVQRHSWHPKWSWRKDRADRKNSSTWN